MGALEDALGQGAKGLVDVDPVLGFLVIALLIVCYVLWRENGILRGRIETYLTQQVDHERAERREAEQQFDRLINAIEPGRRTTRR